MLIPTRADDIVDQYAAAGLEHGDLVVSLRSGQRFPVRCSVPEEGVLRLRYAPESEHPRPSPMLQPLAHRPAHLREEADRVVIEGPGVVASWSRDGAHLRVGEAFQRFPAVEGDKFPFPTGGRAGDLDGRPGWVETVRLAPEAYVYGGGESFQGPDVRGCYRLIRNQEADRTAGLDAAYLNVPLFYTDAGWGLFVHTGGAVRADLAASHSECAAFAVDGGELDLFVILGDPPTILRRYLRLTGAPRRLPDWAFGVSMSRSSYFSESQAARNVAELREAGCPVDVVHVDEWLDEPVLHTATWTAGPDRRRFPAGWGQRLGRQGVRTSLWIAPYVERGTAACEELSRAGYLVRAADGAVCTRADNPDCCILDLFNPDAETWFRQRVVATMREEGNAAFLVDFGEEIPDEAVFADGRRGWEAANAYTVLYHRSVWHAADEARPGDFLLVCRSGTAGSQRYPAHWVGDNPSSWSGMVPALRACLSLSLSGFGVVTHDIGGYWTPASYDKALKLRETMSEEDVGIDVDPELYARWTQWGAFTPVMRFHGVARREPTAYPEPYRSAAIAACRLHERLRGYLVRAGAQAADGGLPMMRPLVLTHHDHRPARDAQLQYLLGDDILVAPIVEPGGRRDVWVPPGRWQPLVGLDAVSGPGWASVECTIEQFPAWLRAGASL